MKMIAAVLLALAGSAAAQFDILDAKTTASLRGIDAVTPQIAWASGSKGTVLLTTDGGANWKHCAVPDGGDKLDFRGVQAFDAKTAFIMASGKGPLSAVYKTIDGCSNWKLVFANPDAEGFFDDIRKAGDSPAQGLSLVGDPVDGKIRVFLSSGDGREWSPVFASGMIKPPAGAGLFAASNSGLQSKHSKDGFELIFGTGATETRLPMVYYLASCPGVSCLTEWISVEVPMAAGGTDSGIFSLSESGTVAVGGNYSKPEDAAGTAAFSPDDGDHWQPAATMPSGYRSAVVYDPQSKAFIAVGPNGCDISMDDGKNWQPLKPAVGDAPDADKNWNAISLPFVVGGRGKIGKLKAGVLAK